ncbi:hypothetical protein BX600DRAFT_500135 [Xylariales sp. PMI_506]|nr:hypothetical protein BX600DRAFT_500135 [Xylariales sp. PMI_506]
MTERISPMHCGCKSLVMDGRAMDAYESSQPYIGQFQSSNHYLDAAFMDFITFVEPEPGALVERFSREHGTAGSADPPGSASEQLQNDITEERKRRAKRIQEERSRIEAQFSTTAFDDELQLKLIQKELEKTMRKFQASLPAGPSNSPIPTCWKDVESAVSDVQAQWDAKASSSQAGRVKTKLRKMCEGLHNHSNALKILPSESEYVSVIAGSITMVVKASVNYNRVTEDFVQGMIDINDSVRLVQCNQTYATPALQKLIMRLYTHIFRYLTKFLEWHSARSGSRFLQSFNENIRTRFAEDLAGVKKLSELISQQIQSYMSAEVHVSRLEQEDNNENIKYLITLYEESRDRSLIEESAYADMIQDALHCQFQKAQLDIENCLQRVIMKYHESLRQQISADSMNLLLQQQVSNDDSLQMLQITDAASGSNCEHKTSETTINAVANFKEAREGIAVEPNQLPRGEGLTQHGTEIKINSKNLEDYFTWEHVYPFSENQPQPMSTLADERLVARMTNFTIATTSQILYAIEPYQVGHGSMSRPTLRRTSGAYAALVRETGVVPVITYFCELTHSPTPTVASGAATELTALLYAMIRQLLELVPAELDPSAPLLMAERFAALDGTLGSWDLGVQVLIDAFTCVQLPFVLFVIDGLNLLENFDDSPEGRDINVKLGQLVRTLRSLVESSRNNGSVVKIMLTTSGASRSLCESLADADVVRCSRPSPRGKGRGRRSMGMTGF